FVLPWFLSTRSAFELVVVFVGDAFVVVGPVVVGLEGGVVVGGARLFVAAGGGSLGLGVLHGLGFHRFPFLERDRHLAGLRALVGAQDARSAHLFDQA